LFSMNMCKYCTALVMATVFFCHTGSGLR